MALLCCCRTWGCGEGLGASPAWLSPLPDGCGVHWVPRCQLCDLLVVWCEARPPSRLWEQDSFPLQAWLLMERAWLCFEAALRLPGVRVEGSSGGHPWQGASAGTLLAPLGSHQCGAAVPCGWVLLADALSDGQLSCCLPQRLLVAARKLCIRMHKGRMLVWTWLFCPMSP